jgi:hypothetical protein
MWGAGVALDLSGQQTVQPPTPSTQQLARVSYARPETWRFFFSGQVLTSSVAAGGGGINVAFDLIIGVGRSVVTVRDFVVMGFPIIGTPADQIQIWATSAKLPPQLGGDTSDHRIDTFISQDIQCNARVTFFTASLSHVQLQLDAFFAPNVHLRPEWFQSGRRELDYNRYRAGEQGGM